MLDNRFHFTLVLRMRTLWGVARANEGHEGCGPAILDTNLYG